MKIIFGLILSYLIGSIPTGYWLVRFLKKVDIREYGSGNIGATNVFRVLGKGWGSLALGIDILKGVVATTLIADIFGLDHIIHRALLGLVAVCGHNWTVFLGFKGGKGIATSLGVLIGLTIKIPVIRPVLVIAVLLWLGVFLLTRIVSLSSITAAVALPIIMVFSNQPLEIVILGVIFCVFVVLRHRANIKRLFAGEEPRVPLFPPKSK